MASVHVQNLKRGRDEFWHGGLVLPEAKRSSNSGHDTDIMALLEKIENIEDINHQQHNNNNITAIVSSEFEDEQEEERLNVVMKSLEDEIGLEPKEDDNVKNGVCVDATVFVNAGEDLKEEETAVADDNNKNPDDHNTGFVDANSEATTSVSDVGDLYYDDIRAEFGFFGDQTEEMGIMANFEGDHSMANIYNSSYVDNTTEVFYGLWEDDIWQLNVNEHGAAAFVQNAEEVGDAAGELNDVGNDIRPIQCLSAGEEGS